MSKPTPFIESVIAARKQDAAKAALFDEMRIALNWAEAALGTRGGPAHRIVVKALKNANNIAGAGK